MHSTIVALAISIVLVCPAVAGASAASVTDGVLNVDAGEGEVSLLELGTEAAGVIDLKDWPQIIAGPGCVERPSPGWSAVRCEGVERVVVDLGDGDDSATFSAVWTRSVPVDVAGGGGDDTIRLEGAEGGATGGSGADEISGGDGADILHGGDGADLIRGHGGADLMLGDGGPDFLTAGRGADRLEGGEGDDTLTGNEDEADDDDAADSLDGGPGDDHLDGEGGPDHIRGGDGIDLLEYFRHTAPVRVALGTTEPGGSAGEGDQIDSDVEGATGGDGDDELLGDARANALYGAGGNDRIDGGAGDDDLSGYDGVDILEGGGGYDELDGGRGEDRLAGGDENDALYGGSGADVLDGEAGKDWFDGEAGDDRLEARDGNAETVTCGVGLGDAASLDADDWPQTCERREWPDRTEQDPPPAPVIGSWAAGWPFRAAGLGASAQGRRVTLTPEGEIHTTWERSYDDPPTAGTGVGSWRPGDDESLVNDIPGGSGAGMAAGGGTLTVVSDEDEHGGGGIFVRQRRSGLDFGPVTRLGGRDSAYYAVAANANGDAAVMYYVDVDGTDGWSLRAFVRRRVAGGPWGPPERLPVDDRPEAIFEPRVAPHRARRRAARLAGGCAWHGGRPHVCRCTYRVAGPVRLSVLGQRELC